MEQLFAQVTELSSLIDFKFAALIIISSYWVKANFSHVFPKISIALKIFIWSTMMSIVYSLVLYFLGDLPKENFVGLLVTYFAATSFYEVFFSPLEKWLKKLVSAKK